jgi:riboflavin-specific deaminase-like protein
LSEPSTESFNPRAVLRADTVDWAWAVLLAAARRARVARTEGGSFALGADGELRRVVSGHAEAVLERRRDGSWASARRVPRELAPLFDLYLPVCAACSGAPLTIGHLGQSVDGYIATHGGDSSYVNGPENILHLHRMRALCDAIVVGASTIAADDPRLTTRLAEGTNPVRVILDPRRRLAPEHRVFTDAAAPSMIVCSAALASDGPHRVGCAEIVGILCDRGELDLAALLEALHARGLHSVFVEGGGATVSRFLEAGLLDRLQIAIAPLIMGGGLHGLRLPASKRIAECLRPAHRTFAMGADILFDCDLRYSGPDVDRSEHAPLERIY